MVYTGITANLRQRVSQHRHEVIDGFTKRYHVHLLVYYEVHPDMRSAIAREKQIKAGTRRKKLELIESKNPQWKDLVHQA